MDQREDRILLTRLGTCLQPAVASKIEYFYIRLPEDGADVYRNV